MHERDQRLASAFSHTNSTTREQMITFINEYRDRFPVEFICWVLKEHRAGGFITARDCRTAQSRPLSARTVKDELLIEEIVKIFDDNYRVYGIPKMWRAMNRESWQIGREQTARLMRQAGIHGARRGRGPITTRSGKEVDTRSDLVNRCFKAGRPNQL